MRGDQVSMCVPARLCVDAYEESAPKAKQNSCTMTNLMRNQLDLLQML